MQLWPHIHNTPVGYTGDAIGVDFETHTHVLVCGSTTPPVDVGLVGNTLSHTHSTVFYKIETVTHTIQPVVPPCGTGLGALGTYKGKAPRKKAKAVACLMSKSSLQASAIITSTALAQATLFGKATLHSPTVRGAALVQCSLPYLQCSLLARPIAIEKVLEIASATLDSLPLMPDDDEEELLTIATLLCGHNYLARMRT
jgi:hypothetical protein